MKVLHVINSLPIGGAERLIVDSVPVYQKKEIYTDVLILKGEETDFSRKLRRLSKGKIITLSKGSSYNPFLVFKLMRYLKLYDIVHVHLFPAFYWVVIAKVLSRSKTSIVYTEHSTNNRRRGNVIFKMLDKYVYSKISFVGCISKGVKEELLKHLKPYKTNKPKVEVISNGINLLEYNPSQVSKTEVSFFDDNDKVLIQVSSFRASKDQKTLINAITLLPDTVKLLLVGEGTLLEEHKEYVKVKGLDGRVKFLGNRTDIPNLLGQADIVVLSSNWEGFGLAAVEGMAAAKPVVASEVPGLSEIVGGYGLLFHKGDEQDLAAKIQSLLNSSEFYVKIAAKCESRSKDFSIDLMIDKYIEIYKKYKDE